MGFKFLVRWKKVRYLSPHHGVESDQQSPLTIRFLRDCHVSLYFSRTDNFTNMYILYQYNH